MNIGVVHEWLDHLAGSERVVEQFLQAFPIQDLYVLADFMSAEERSFLRDETVHTSFLQRLPFARKHFRQYLPLMPMAIEQFDLSAHDVVLSSNHCVAKGVITRADQMHVSYTHTPVRYAWELQHEYLAEGNLSRGIKGRLVRATLHYLRMWDRASADRVDAFVANSRYIAQRIWKTYRRQAHVVYPPVDVDAFTLRADKEDFYLAASRLVPYKRIDLIVDAFAQMPDRRLVVIGDGTEYKKIAAKATSNVQILGYQPFDVLLDHMQRARAFVFAAMEDFGIIPVEAQACGTPVIAFGKGGACETVIDGKTGVLYSRQTVDSLREAIAMFERLEGTWEPEYIREHAARFSPHRFREEMREVVDRLWTRFCRHHRQDDHELLADTAFPLDRSRANFEPAELRGWQKVDFAHEPIRGPHRGADVPTEDVSAAKQDNQ